MQHFPRDDKRHGHPSRQQIAAASTELACWTKAESELHALVLEDALIKMHLPIANKRQKKFMLQEYIGLSKAYPKHFVSFSAGGPVPDNVERYFGPFSDRFFVKRLLQFGNRFFGIACGQLCGLTNTELGQKVSFDGKGADAFCSFLTASDTQIFDHLENLMSSYASSRQFELAAKTRDNIEFCRDYFKRHGFQHNFKHRCLAIRQVERHHLTWLFTRGRLTKYTSEEMSRGTITRHFISETQQGHEREPDWAVFDRAQVVRTWLFKNRRNSAYWFESPDIQDHTDCNLA